MTQLKHVFDLAHQALELYDSGKLDDAKALTLHAESHQSAFADDREKALCRRIVAGCLVDIGYAANDREMIARGTQYFEEWVERYGAQDELSYDYYNLANGYISSWKLEATLHLKDGVDAEDNRLSRHYYRLAIQNLRTQHLSDGLACLLWTNYGNSLDFIGRYVEAIDAYDAALRIDENMGMALGNKAVALAYLAPVVPGYTHLFYLESLRLLEKALQQPLLQDAKAGFQRKLQELKQVLELHDHKLAPEHVQGIQPATEFHQFLCEFCSQHSLFLNPVTFLGAEGKAFYGDPMFISNMYAKLDEQDRFDRYATFLNEIKQDYILGRYFLVQSQYASAEIDAVDEGVTLIYPLDYSLNSTYIQLLKTAQKQAIAVLDKVAYFIYDYCGLTTPQSDRVTFRQLFGGNNKIRKEFDTVLNRSVFALFSLAYDCSKKGDWNVFHDYRDALTHRFLILHDLGVPVSTSDLPRISEATFLNHTILAFKVARAAVMYLILFVEHQEHERRGQSKGLSMPIYATPVEGVFRHRPRFPLPRVDNDEEQ